jgi:hypothetical protein
MLPAAQVNGWVLDLDINLVDPVVYWLPPQKLAASERGRWLCTVTQTGTVQGWLFR